MPVNSSSETTILAVDDRPDNLFTLEKVITEHLPGCTVLTAGSAAGGLSFAAETPIDGILIDVQMPQMDGVEMCRQLKANSATAHIPIILMTAHGADATQKALGLDAGADDFINKPIDNAELVARVSAILRIKKTEDQLRLSASRLAALADHRTRQLADSEHYYRSLLYNLHEDVIVIDRNYVITDINNSYLATVGRSAEDVIGRRCYEISYGFDNPCDQYGRECPLRKVFDAGLPCRCQHTHTDADGTKVYVDILASPMKDKEGNITHMVEAIRDITPLMEAQEQHRAIDRQYRSVVEDSDVLICRFAPGGVLTFVNGAYCRYFGKSPEELVGTNFLSLIPAEDREPVTDYLSDLTVDSPVASHENQVMAPGGELRWQRWTSRALFDDEGRLVAYQAFGEDITEQRSLETQLRQAQKMEAVGRLAGGIAHDFRNQLTVITGYSEWLLSQMDDDNEIAPEIREILNAARRSTDLTGHLLALSRREILESRVLDPLDLIVSLTEPMKHMIGEDVVLVTSGADDLDNITVDPGQFQHMLMNLAVNARDAMPHGGELMIDVTAAELGNTHKHRHLNAPPGKYVAITVSDTGVGMDAETRRNAFDPFFTTKPAGEGTGLGLSMVYGFVTQSGGYITVDSKVGQGTTFTIYLPGSTDPPEETTPVEAAPAVAAEATGTILAVEDNQQLRNMLAEILRQGGNTVMTAGNALEAMPLGEHYEGRIDLLITDVVMPGMSGVGLAGRLQAVRPDIAVLFISGHGDTKLIRQGLAADNTELLLKPFGAAELLDAVNRMLA